MKTLKQSWLHGTPKKKYINFLIGGPLPIARMYFANWTDLEIKQCWNDLEKVLNGFIKKIGRKSFLINPITILSSDSLISRYEPFSDFYFKWQSRFEAIPTKPEEPVYLSKVLLSIYLLKKASEDILDEVIDIFERLSSRELYEIKLKNEGKNAISSQNRKNSRASKKSILRKHIELIPDIKKPKVSYLNVIRKLNQIEGIKIQQTKLENKNYIKYTIKTNKTKSVQEEMPLTNFIKFVSKINRTFVK